MITSEDVPSLGCLCRDAGEQALQRHLTSCRIFSGPTADMTVGGASQNSITALLSTNLAVKTPTLLHHLDISPHPPTRRPSQPRPPCILSTGEALNPPSHLFPSQTSSTEHFAAPIFPRASPEADAPSAIDQGGRFGGLCKLAAAGVSLGYAYSQSAVLRTVFTMGTSSQMGTLTTASVGDRRRPRPASGDARPGRCGA